MPIYGPQLANGTITTTQIAAGAAIKQSQMATAWDTSVNANGNGLSNLPTAVNPGDAIPFSQAVALFSGGALKANVQAASLTNLAGLTYATTGGLNGAGQITTAPNAIDGVTLTVGMVIGLPSQSSATQGGLWQVATVGTGSNGVWNRSTYWVTGEVVSGALFDVVQGSAGAGTIWMLTVPGTITIDGASGTAQTFTQTNANTTGAGNGLTKTGNNLSVNPQDASLLVSSSGVKVQLADASLSTVGGGLEVAPQGVSAAKLGAVAGGGLTGGAGAVVTLWQFADTYTGDGSTTARTLTHTPYSQTGSTTDASASCILVYLNGVKQIGGTDFTRSGATITFATAPASGWLIEAVYPRSN